MNIPYVMSLSMAQADFQQIAPVQQSAEAQGYVSPNPRFFPEADFHSFLASTFHISTQKRKVASAGSRADAGFTSPTGACQA
jgi:hypothetical protein